MANTLHQLETSPFVPFKILINNLTISQQLTSPTLEIVSHYSTLFFFQKYLHYIRDTNIVVAVTNPSPLREYHARFSLPICKIGNIIENRHIFFWRFICTNIYILYKYIHIFFNQETKNDVLPSLNQPFPKWIPLV